MTAKEIILEQFAACHNNTNWFVPLNTAIGGLTEEQAEMKDSGNSSIKEIVSHLLYWNDRHLKRFKGIEPGKAESNNDATFPGSLSWEDSVQALDKVLTDFTNAVKEASEDKLLSEVIKGQKGNWYGLLTQASIHNAYHIGQIVTIRKQQGTWDKEKGVS